ncbi:hypothetical protein Tco_1244316 [Tanacetum coccineum]
MGSARRDERAPARSRLESAGSTAEPSESGGSQTKGARGQSAQKRQKKREKGTAARAATARAESQPRVATARADEDVHETARSMSQAVSESESVVRAGGWKGRQYREREGEKEEQTTDEGQPRHDGSEEEVAQRGARSSNGKYRRSEQQEYVHGGLSGGGKVEYAEGRTTDRRDRYNAVTGDVAARRGATEGTRARDEEEEKGHAEHTVAPTQRRRRAVEHSAERDSPGRRAAKRAGVERDRRGRAIESKRNEARRELTTRAAQEESKKDTGRGRERVRKAERRWGRLQWRQMTEKFRRKQTREKLTAPGKRAEVPARRGEAKREKEEAPRRDDSQQRSDSARTQRPGGQRRPRREGTIVRRERLSRRRFSVRERANGARRKRAGTARRRRPIATRMGR